MVLALGSHGALLCSVLCALALRADVWRICTPVLGASLGTVIGKAEGGSIDLGFASRSLSDDDWFSVGLGVSVT